MKKGMIVLLIMVVALILLPQAAQADHELDLKDGSIVLYLDGAELWFTQGTANGTYRNSLTITQSVAEITANTVTVKSGDHNVLLDGDTAEPIHIKTSEAPPISVENGSTLTLTIKGDVALDTKYGQNHFAALHVAQGAKATIITEANATLTVSSNGAGIGGNENEQCGDIVLDGKGSIIATGGGGGAGIGGGKGGSSGVIMINGGTVNATGSVGGAGVVGGAGIGGGNGGSGDVIISGGTITAMGGGGGAAIGGGNGGNGIVTIENGTIAAVGMNGAGIGSGNNGSGVVTISGGTITAQNSFSGAGIGSGNNGSGVVTISGGTITATGGNQSAGIGGGFSGKGEVTITNGTITATSGNGGAGIGGGVEGSGDVTISGGTITATGAQNAPGIGGGATRIASAASSRSKVTLSGVDIYSGTTADPTKRLKSYAGESPVHITDGTTNDTTEDLPDADGNNGTVGAGAEGGTPIITQLSSQDMTRIASEVNGKPVLGADISATSGELVGVSMNIINDSLANIAGHMKIDGYVIAHEISPGNIEALSCTATRQGDRTIFSLKKKPTSNSPFVLVMYVSDPPAPPRTGDDSAPLMWLSLCLLCGAGLTTLAIRTRKRRG